MADGLTPKQERYVQELVAGKSQREAYRVAYPSSVKWKDSSVDSKASELLNSNVKVLERYRDLIKANSRMALWTREEAFSDYEWLKKKAAKDIEEQGVRQANSQAYLTALDGMTQIAHRDPELADKKLAAEIRRIQAETNLMTVSPEDEVETSLEAFRKAMGYEEEKHE